MRFCFNSKSFQTSGHKLYGIKFLRINYKSGSINKENSSEKDDPDWVKGICKLCNPYLVSRNRYLLDNYEIN